MKPLYEMTTQDELISRVREGLKKEIIKYIIVIGDPLDLFFVGPFDTLDSAETQAKLFNKEATIVELYNIRS